MSTSALALLLLRLTGVDGSEIDVNPAEIVSLRNSASDEDTFHAGAMCVVKTVDGSFFGVRESCEAIRERFMSLREW